MKLGATCGPVASLIAPQRLRRARRTAPASPSSLRSKGSEDVADLSRSAQSLRCGETMTHTTGATSSQRELLAMASTPQQVSCQHMSYQAGAASMSQTFIALYPARFLPRVLPRVARPSGPMSVFLILFTIISTIFAAIRRRIMQHVRACTDCHGYGIQRCSLCEGRGSVGWEGKWSHKEPCPMCLGRRFTDCRHCGGRFHRPIFNHVRCDPAKAAGFETESEEAATSPQSTGDWVLERVMGD